MMISFYFSVWFRFTFSLALSLSLALDFFRSSEPGVFFVVVVVGFCLDMWSNVTLFIYVQIVFSGSHTYNPTKLRWLNARNVGIINWH